MRPISLAATAAFLALTTSAKNSAFLTVIKTTSLIEPEDLPQSSATAIFTAPLDPSPSSPSISPPLLENTTITTTPPDDTDNTDTHVDTILNTRGVYSTAQVEASKLRAFCTLGDAFSDACKSLQNLVHLCVDKLGIDCQPGAAKALLDEVVSVLNCPAVAQDSLQQILCSSWWTEAHRCKVKTRRSACAHAHVLWLLRGLRDFLDLPEENVELLP